MKCTCKNVKSTLALKWLKQTKIGELYKGVVYVRLGVPLVIVCGVLVYPSQLGGAVLAGHVPHHVSARQHHAGLHVTGTTQQCTLQHVNTCYNTTRQYMLQHNTSIHATTQYWWESQLHIVTFNTSVMSFRLIRQYSIPPSIGRRIAKLNLA